MHVRFYEVHCLLHISISICLSLLHARLPGTYHTLVPCSGPLCWELHNGFYLGTITQPALLPPLSWVFIFQGGGLQP